MAKQNIADLPDLIRLATDLRPDAKSAERLKMRITGRTGVVRTAVTGARKRVTFIARAVRPVEAQVAGETAFHEAGLIYVRAQVGLVAHRIGFQLSAASFCRHALERLVERSDVPLDAAVLPHVDAEAQAILRGWDCAARIEEAGDEFYPAARLGLWAGGHDAMALDPDRNLLNACGSLPVFWARTLLSPAEIRPMVWLRWRDNSSCPMA